MIYAKVDVDLRDHLKAHKAGSAMATWLWGLLYARGQQTDGHVPDLALRLSWAGEKESRRHAVLLVEAGLWENTDGGWRILKYAEKNSTKNEVDENKARARERMQRVRANRTRTNGEPPPKNFAEVPGSGSGSGSDLGSREGEPEREPEAEATTEVKPAKFRYREAYARGIAKGKGSPWAWPPSPQDAWADKDLGSAIVTFAHSESTGKGLRGDDLIGWIEAAAQDFVEHVKRANDDPKFWSAFAPKGLLKFLNQEVRAQEARDVG